MDREELSEKEAHKRTKESLEKSGFVEKQLAGYVVRHLVSWQVDPETGIQSHYTEESRIRGLLRSVTEYLGHPIRGEAPQVEEEARAFSELLQEPEFASLYRNLKKYTALDEGDKSEIRAWWELVNRMVEERLSRE
jgi:hypothetical protein